MKVTSAGLLMYRVRNGQTEVFLVHPGGPFYTRADEGAWSIPKGEVETHENHELETAQREFIEETGFTPHEPFILLPPVKSKGGKTVHAWAFKGDADPRALTSNMISIEWPPKSGKQMKIPEVDRGDFFTIAEAKKKIVPYMLPLIEAFEKL
jgi:predicted NUDIX family NTP pyrophosphohydrolase